VDGGVPPSWTSPIGWTPLLVCRRKAFSNVPDFAYTELSAV